MDPYKVLGVSPHASEDEIKATYRELARKYHPDNYHDNPLSDLAGEKMAEINRAYDLIIEMRRTGRRAYDGGYAQSSAGNFADVRAMINTGRIIEAEEILSGTPQARRDAEWHFLMGTVNYSRGWLDEAHRHFQTAARMNPQNHEYAAALSRMTWQRGGGRTGQGGYTGNTGGCNGCDVCGGLLCADCCCECMGGDLIRCC